MQQRQLLLGDILDDYCPRERRLTNHAVVAMVGSDVKQTRCTTCDAEHDYKHAKVPRQRRKAQPAPVLYSPALAGGPKRVVHDPPADDVVGENESSIEAPVVTAELLRAAEIETPKAVTEPAEDAALERDDDDEDGPVHRPLIRATLPRQEGQPPLPRQGPDFTIRQPGGRADRFRARHPHGRPQFHGNRPSGGGMGGPMRSGMPRPHNTRPPLSRVVNRHGSGRKRSK